MTPSDISWQWNADFLVESRTPEQVILRNDLNGALISLSQGEFELLRTFASDNGADTPLPEVYEIEENTLQAILQKAKDLELLTPDGHSSFPPKKITLFQQKIIWVGNRTVGLLQHFTRLPLQVECCGNLRFFKLFSIHLEGSRIERAALSDVFQRYLPWGYFILLFLLVLPLPSLLDTFSFAGFGMSHLPVGWLFPALIVCICLCLMWHEMGHYVIYKRYGGKGNRMGIGTLFGFFPVFYTQISQIQLWEERRNRLLLTGAGILADLLPFLGLTLLLSSWHTPCFVHLLCDCMFFFYAGQTVTNLNFLIPGTDGYYLFEEMTGEERLYGNAYETFRTFIHIIHTRRKGAPPLSGRQKLLILYFLLCCVSITCYWMFVTLFFFFPLWSGFLG